MLAQATAEESQERRSRNGRRDAGRRRTVISKRSPGKDLDKVRLDLFPLFLGGRRVDLIGGACPD